jgi:hypothetical protein
MDTGKWVSILRGSQVAQNLLKCMSRARALGRLGRFALSVSVECSLFP